MKFIIRGGCLVNIYIYIYKTNYISPRVHKRIGTPVLYVYTLGGRSTVSTTACNLIERVLC